MKTEAAILVELGKPLEVVALGVPALRAGQALIEIAYSGVCGTQVNEWLGKKGEDKWLPHCLGHEATGVVMEVGPGVTKVKASDKVVLSWLKGSGLEAGGAVYDWDGRRVNAGGVTTFQRHAVVSENRLSRLPEGLPMDVATMLGCAAPTGMGAVINVLKVRPGDSIAIFGTGGVGLNAVMAAAFSGATTIVGVDPSPLRRSLAKLYGATHVVDPAEGDPLEQIRAVVPHGVDVAVEASGLPAVMALAMQATRMQGGRAVVVGNASHGSMVSVDAATLNQGKSLLGTWGGDSDPDRDFPRFGRLLGAGRFPVRDLLSKPYKLGEATEALRALAAGATGRPLIDMSLA
jgi:S-(hydroxymethyl)glutathione dehydrogenase / alcohol dehydrogenase